MKTTNWWLVGGSAALVLGLISISIRAEHGHEHPLAGFGDVALLAAFVLLGTGLVLWIRDRRERR
ncbi:hypothetical protein [Microbacterium gilvum]|uniref:LPXTG cell wall anchor domain-containing protein n=1 Tax=Microbacterium gilvum TaxID=1336204 RepID=A0ABP8ZPT1_9MICO